MPITSLISRSVYVHDERHILWASDQVSHDGIRQLSYEDGVVHGIGTMPGSDDDAAFEIDSDSGKAKGGYADIRWTGLH